MMQIQTGFAEVNSARLYYEVAGSGQPLVLIHGFSLDTRMWDDQFETLARHYQVVRYDLRGFGKSATPAGESYTHADDLKALLDHLGLAKVNIAGLSLGGGVALNFALAYPEAVYKLILIESILGGYQWSERARAQDGAVWARGRESGVEAARTAWLKHPLFGPLMANPAVAAKFTRIVSDYSGWHWVNRDRQRWPDPPALQLLERITASLLVIVGERDLPDFHAIADILERRIPSARKVVVPGAGHMANMEAPEQVNEIILSFLEAV